MCAGLCPCKACVPHWLGLCWLIEALGQKKRWGLKSVPNVKWEQEGCEKNLCMYVANVAVKTPVDPSGKKNKRYASETACSESGAKMVPNQWVSPFSSDGDSQTLCGFWTFTSYPMASLSRGHVFKQMTVQLLPPARRQTAGSFQLTKWCSLSKSQKAFTLSSSSGRRLVLLIHPSPKIHLPLSSQCLFLFQFISAPSLAGENLLCMHLFIFAFSFSCTQCSPVFFYTG